MNYYHITTGIEDSDNSDAENEDVPDIVKFHKGVGHMPSEETNHLHQAVTKCLSQSTVDDIKKEYEKNAMNNNGIEARQLSQPPNTSGSNGVVLRRKTSNSRTSYSHRASQRFSRLLEGVSSLVPSLTGYKQEDSQDTGQDISNEDASSSLPYWIEATQNIQKVSHLNI